MGNWAIHIQGVGCHHNDKPFDVEKLTAVFVKELKAQGHSVQAATVTAGSMVDCDPPTKVCPPTPDVRKPAEPVCGPRDNLDPNDVGVGGA
jgi:hypothetical protein